MTVVTKRPWLSAQRGSQGPVVLVLLSCVGASIALIPLVYLLVRVRDAGWEAVTETLGHSSVPPLIARSLGLAAVVTASCIVIGVALAWLVVRAEFVGRRTCALLAPLPLAMPTYVAAFAWRSAFPDFTGFWAAALVLTLCSYPYVYLPVVAALRSADPALEDVSRALGVGPFRTFLRITLRQIRPAIAGGGLLVALYVLSDFGAVAILRCTTFTRAIFLALDLGFDRITAIVLSTVLVAVTTVLVFGELVFRGKAMTHGGAGARRRRPRVRLRSSLLPATGGLAALFGLAFIVPVISLGYWVAQAARARIDWSELVAAAWGSATVSAAGALLTVALAIPIGILAARHRGLLPVALERVTWLSHALPGVVVGLSLVAFGINVAYPYYQTTTLLAVGYAVLFLPLAVSAVQVAAGQAPPILEETARSLGKSPFAVFRTVTVPLASPGIVAAALLVFLTCVKELPVTLLLRPTELSTLATELWSQTSIAAYSAAAPYAAALLLLSAIPTYLLGRRLGMVDGVST